MYTAVYKARILIPTVPLGAGRSTAKRRMMTREITTMKQLVELRHGAGLRQLDVAESLNMHRARLALFETADEIRPTSDFVKRYIAAIGEDHDSTHVELPGSHN